MKTELINSAIKIRAR